MSVLLPWDRKGGRDGRAATVSGVDRSRKLAAAMTKPYAPPAKRRRMALPALAAVGILLLVAATAIALAYLPARLPVIWERNGAALVDSDAGSYLLKIGDSYSVIGPSGTQVELGPAGGVPALASGAVFAADQGRLRALLAQGAGEDLSALTPGEKICGSLADGTILTTRPSLGVRFGETWTLRAISRHGATLWESQLPGPPALSAEGGEGLLVAAVDLSSGGLPVLLRLGRATGTILWATTLQPGLWRAAGFTSGGAIAVLDSGVRALAADGSPAWTYAPEQPILSAAVIEGQVAIATGGSLQGAAGYLFPYAVTAVAAPGTPLWTARVNQEPRSIVKWSGGAPGKTAAVALGETHVIGFSLRDGERMFGVRTGSRPVRLAGDCLLMQDRGGVRLVRFDPLKGAGAKPL